MSLKDQITDLREGLPKTFCPVPFTTIILEPDGMVGMCRNLGLQYPIGNISESSVMDIWNSEKAKKIRHEHLSGKIEICSSTIHERKCHLIEQWNEILPYAQLEENQTVPILKLTANFNGKCNLACPMCHVRKHPNGLYNKLNFWGPASESIFPHLKEIDLLAGEPFIQQDTFRLMDDVYKVNPECRWNITTNLHWDFNDKIEFYIQKLNFRNITISIDSLDATTFNIVRYPGKLSVVIENLTKLLSIRDNKKSTFEITINMTLQKENRLDADAMIDFCIENKIIPHVVILKDPEELSILNLPEAERKNLIEHYLEKIPNNKISYLLRVIPPIANSLSAIDRNHYMLCYQQLVKRSINETP